MSKYDKLRDRPRPRVNRLFKATNILLSIYIEPHILYIIRYDLNPSSLPIPMGETPPLFYNTAQDVTLIRYPLELVQPQAAEDEEHLNEGCSKWNDPSKNDSHWRAQVPRHRKGRTEKRMGIMDITKGVLGVYC